MPRPPSFQLAVCSFSFKWPSFESKSTWKNHPLSIFECIWALSHCSWWSASALSTLSFSSTLPDSQTALLKSALWTSCTCLRGSNPSAQWWIQLLSEMHPKTCPLSLWSGYTRESKPSQRPLSHKEQMPKPKSLRLKQSLISLSFADHPVRVLLHQRASSSEGELNNPSK